MISRDPGADAESEAVERAALPHSHVRRLLGDVDPGRAGSVGGDAPRDRPHRAALVGDQREPDAAFPSGLVPTVVARCYGTGVQAAFEVALIKSPVITAESSGDDRAVYHCTWQ